MFRALTTSASGMLAQQTNLDVLSNNLANSSTTGYKSQKAEFADLIYQTQSISGGATGPTSFQPTSIQVGLGTKWAGNSTDFTQGSLLQSNNPLDVAIQGNGFFQVTGPDGKINYTRDGSFKLDSAGTIVTSQGYPLANNVAIPAGASNVTVSGTGVIMATVPGDTVPKQIGQMEIATFANPAGLVRVGDNLYQEGGASGQPVVGNPGENGAGALSSGFTEGSNVSVVDEMVQMITAQRSYEINSKAIQTADSMMSVANNLKQ